MPLIIQYLDPATNQAMDSPAQIYVRQGTTVRFKVVMRPQSNPPINLAKDAVWSNNTRGENATYVFNAASIGTAAAQGTAVRVTVGNQAAQVAVTVYRFTLQLQPVVATQTPNRTHFGVDERINLSFATVPAGITAATIGGLRWKLQGVATRKRKGQLQRTAVNKLDPDVDGVAYYIAPYLTDDASETIQNIATKTVTLELAVVAGLSKGQTESTNITIHRPTGVMTPVAGKNKHTLNEPSAGFIGAITFTPDDVSFSNLEFREASGTLTATGCFKGWASGWQRGTGQTEKSHTPTVIGGDGIPIERNNNRNEGVEDDVWTPYNPGDGPTRHAGWDGTYLWKIYWQYRVRAEFRGSEPDSWVRFQVAEHRSTSDNAGRCTTTKAGGTATFSRTDAESPIP